MKKLLLIIFTSYYMIAQLNFSLCCITNYVSKEVAEQAYNKHLKNLPARFNMLSELNKAKEHQQHQNNIPDFAHQIALSEYYQPQNNFNISVNSKVFDYSFHPASKVCLGFLKRFSPPPDGIFIG